MDSKLGLLGIIFVGIALSGCATMSGDECLTSDWNAIGYEDGVRGYNANQLGERRKACAKHGVTPDFQAYQSGRKEGLVEYCQPTRGFAVGENGGAYNGVCSAHQEGHFLDAYNAGYHLYALRTNVNRANSAIRYKEREIDRNKEEIRSKEVELISDETTTEGRVVLLMDLKELSENIGRLEAEIDDLHEQLARARAELENYQVSVADFGY